MTTIRTLAQRIQELTAVGLTPAEALPAAQQEYAAEMAAIAAAENARAEEAKRAAAESTSDVWDFHGLKIRGGKGKNGLPTSWGKGIENGMAVLPAGMGKDANNIDQYYPPCIWVVLKGQAPQQVRFAECRGLYAVHQANPEALVNALAAVASPDVVAEYERVKAEKIASGEIPKPGKKR